MGVYIKGMAMPKNCDECPCYYETEGAWRNECEVLRKEYTASENRPSWCPLIEVKPHGRLIDADALMRQKGDCYDADGHLLYAVGTGNIMCAPTIIESEEEDG